MLALSEPLRSAPKGTPIPGWVHDILAQRPLWAPSERFASMEALLDALDDDPSGRRRRKYVTAGVVAMALALGGFGVARSVARQSQECVVDPKELAGTWDEVTKQDCLRSLRAQRGRRRGSSASGRVEKVLDGVATRWAGMRAEVCEATRVHHAQSHDIYELRMDCLDRRRTELRALTTLLRQGDPQVAGSSRSTRSTGSPAWVSAVTFKGSRRRRASRRSWSQRARPRGARRARARKLPRPRGASSRGARSGRRGGEVGARVGAPGAASPRRSTS